MQNLNLPASVDKFKSMFKFIDLDHLAQVNGFMKRKPKKIYPRHLFFSLLLLVIGEGNSLTNLATKIGLLSHYVISKQAVHKRINAALVKFLSEILSIVIIQSSSLKNRPKFNEKLFENFNRVLLQDSTSIKIDPKLADVFPGAQNQARKRNATLKIQAVIDILTEKFTCFNITPFTKNDQSVSKDILDIAQPYDLIIRDLGYFSVPVFKEMDSKNIFFFESA